MRDPLILSNVSVSAEGQALFTLSAEVKPSEILTVMGPSGSGKSSLLAYVGGFLPPAMTGTGRIMLGPKDLTNTPAHQRGVGILFQDDLLFPHMSVGQNLRFAVPSTLDRNARDARIASALESVDLGGFQDRDPATLSGGQRARVSLIRTMLAEPRALLLDEPFSKLDSNLRAQVRAKVFNHARSAGLPTILVTHDPEDAAAAEGDIVTL